MDNRNFLAGMLLLGTVIGLSASYLVGSSPSECKKVQEEIRAGQNFTGSVSCYPPGTLDVNVSDQVEEDAELKCVCRKINDDQVQLFPILHTD